MPTFPSLLVCLNERSELKADALNTTPTIWQTIKTLINANTLTYLCKNCTAWWFYS